MTADELLPRLRSVLEPALCEVKLDRLAAHNRAYAMLYQRDRFEHFVVLEWPYYRWVLDWYSKNVPAGASVLEIGMFVPVVPLLLAWAGYRVSAVEKLSLVGNAIGPLIRVAEENGVRFLDDDVMSRDFRPGRFDVVNLLCVVEHLPGSPKRLLLRIREMLVADGRLVFVVPNQARLVRRLGLFLGGLSVQPRFDLYFESEYPFSGHHREYTRDEVQFALRAAGYAMDELGSVRYPPRGSLPARVVTMIGNLLPATFHQCIRAVARPMRDAGRTP